MVTLIRRGAWYETNVMEIRGLSTDTKPTSTMGGYPIPNGSTYEEIDTGVKYMFDAENKVWYETELN